MTDIVHLQKYFIYGVLLYQEAIVTCENRFLATLLKYAFDQTKRPCAGRVSIHILYRTLSTKTQILMGLFKKFSAP